MTSFDLSALISDLETAMGAAAGAQAQVTALLKAAVAEHGPEPIIRALEAAIPAGASIGEMIVHRSSKVTVLYGRIPAHFRSAIHDHTVFACIAQLSGAETSVVYEPTADGRLRVAERIEGRPGDVTTLAVDAIHHIENPTDEVASALHVYGGDFDAVKEERSLWTHDDHERGAFSFERLLAQSVDAMKKTGNEPGLRGLVEAIPAAEALVTAN